MSKFLIIVLTAVAPQTSSLANPWPVDTTSTHLSLHPKLLGALGKIFLQQTILVLALLNLLHDDGTEGGGEEESTLIAAAQGVHGARLAFILDHALALAAAAVVHHDTGALEVPEDGESTVQQLVAHPRPEVLHFKCTLVWGEPNLHRSSVRHLPVHLPLGLLSVLAVIHSEECEVFLRVVEKLPDLSKLGQILFEFVLAHTRCDVADVEAGAAGELAFAGVDGWELVCRALDLLQPLCGGIPSEPAKLAAAAAAPTAHPT